MKGLLFQIVLFFIIKCEEKTEVQVTNDPDLQLKEEFKDLENDSEKDKKEQIPEFIENVEDQIYLDMIGEQDRYTLDLFAFQTSVEDGTLDLKEQFGHSCQADIMRALQLKGMKAPVLKVPHLEECHKMTYNCCTEEDIVRIKNETERLDKNTQYNHQYNSLFIREIFKNHKKYVKKIEKIKDKHEHQICKNAANIFESHYIDENVLKEIDDMLFDLQLFDLNFKKGSLCYICDFHNHKHFDLQNQTTFFNVDVCHEIVQKTFKSFYHFNTFVWKYINTVNFLAHCYKKNINGVGYFSLDKTHSFDFLKIDNSLYIEDCMFAIENKKKDQRILASCLNYCHKYNFYQQGYPIFQDIMKLSRIFKNIISSFLPDYVDDIEYPTQQLEFNFDFSDFDKDVFANFNRVFSQDGIHVQHMTDIILT